MKNEYSPNHSGRRVVAMAIGILMLCGAPAPVCGQDDVPELKLDENGIPEGYMIIEGDIIVPIGGTVAATYQVNLWPQGNPTIVPFTFDTSVSAANQTVTFNAMAIWEAVADVDFRPRAGEDNFILIRDSSSDSNPANNSFVGMIGGQQVINITNWGNPFILGHELGHALGFEHEQGRVNMTTLCNGGPCVQINCGNISFSDQCNNVNFVIQSGGGNYGPYDFDSLMHYGRCNFSNNRTACTSTCPSNTGETVTVQPPNAAVWQCGNPAIDPVGDTTFIGQRTHLSKWDVLVMSFLYQEGNWRFLDNHCGDRGGLCVIGGVICFQFGSFFCPFVDDWAVALNETPTGGTLWILGSDTYSIGGILFKPMTIRAPLGATLTP